MGVVSVILGIIALLICFPILYNYYFSKVIIIGILAVSGIVFGIIEISKKSKLKLSKKMGICGIVLNSLALIPVFLLFFVLIIMAGDSIH